MTVSRSRSRDPSAVPVADAPHAVEDELVAAFKDVAAMLAEQQQRIHQLTAMVNALAELVLDHEAALEAPGESASLGDEHVALENRTRQARSSASARRAQTAGCYGAPIS